MRPSLAGLLLLAAGILSSPVLAQESAVDPIDATLATCLAEPGASGTADSVACFAAARDAWEKEVTRAYFALSMTLDARSRGILRGAQKQWEAYLAAERRFQAASWTRQHGPDIAVTLASQDAELFKARALTLRNYKPGG
ncbi:MAG: lysozyme inhibitor LprI family protein [Candidatus Kaistia colombiensis]|nr:MAG: lysozyme inhibitor LprI family protein [Kaistia sp.]